MTDIKTVCDRCGLPLDLDIDIYHCDICDEALHAMCMDGLTAGEWDVETGNHFACLNRTSREDVPDRTVHITKAEASAAVAALDYYLDTMYDCDTEHDHSDESDCEGWGPKGRRDLESIYEKLRREEC